MIRCYKMDFNDPCVLPM